MPRVAPDDLTPEWLELMRELDRRMRAKEPLDQTAIAEAVGKSKSSVQQMFQRLTARGWYQPPELVPGKLTPAGRAVLRRVGG